MGILEGEGTFGAASPSTPGIPFVRLCMTDRDVVERAAALWQRALFPVDPRQTHYRTPYVTVIKGSSAVRLMALARPEMGRSRQAQIDKAIASWHGHPAGRRSSSPVTELPDHPCDQDCTLAWLSGLLEGEGTFTTTRADGHTYPVLALKMCDEDVVERAAAVLGAASVSLRRPKYDRWSDTYAAKISGHHAATWMRTLRPFMGQRRREAIDAALSVYHPIQLHAVPDHCVVPGCDDIHRARGLCHKHYMNWSRDLARGSEPRVSGLR